MRPAGEIRQAIGRAARELAAERSVRPVYCASGSPVAGGTWRELAERACVGYAAARATVMNMTRAGELGAVGALRVDGSRRPMALYAPAMPAAGAATLDGVLRGWPRG